MELTLGGKAIPHGWMPSALTLAPDMRLPTPVIRGAEDNEESRHWSDSWNDESRIKACASHKKGALHFDAQCFLV